MNFQLADPKVVLFRRDQTSDALIYGGLKDKGFILGKKFLLGLQTVVAWVHFPVSEI